MKLSILAPQLGAKLIGHDAEVTGVASVKSATASDLIFVDDPKHLAAAVASPAAAVIAGDFAANETTKPLLISWQPRLDFARAAALLVPTLAKEARAGHPRIHPTSVIDPSAKVAPSAQIGPHVVIEAGAYVGERTVLCAGAFVAANVSVGDDCDIRANVSIYSGTTIGNRVLVHSG